MVQGTNDPRVKKAESDQIVKALEDRGIIPLRSENLGSYRREKTEKLKQYKVPYLVKSNEGHVALLKSSYRHKVNFSCIFKNVNFNLH